MNWEMMVNSTEKVAVRIHQWPSSTHMQLLRIYRDSIHDI